MTELRFDGQTVVVTGAGRGIGRCHALLLASRGANVVVADFGSGIDGSGSSDEPAARVVEEIEADGGTAVACYASVADEAGAASIVETAIERFGGLHAVVNNAGISDKHRFEDLSLDHWDLINPCPTIWVTSSPDHKKVHHHNSLHIRQPPCRPSRRTGAGLHLAAVSS